MYDTVTLRLLQSDVPGISFLEETASYLQRPSEHRFPNGSVAVTGYLGSMKISVNGYQLRAGDCSLAKWQLGDNLQTLTRRDTAEAIERLSDTLHVPMARAEVTRLDVGTNFIMKHPPGVYLAHLGVLRGKPPLKEPSGVYYPTGAGRLCFYDKEREQRAHGEPIPELYRGQYVLRYEQRHARRLPKQFKVAKLTAAILSEEAFYIETIDQWRGAYKAIEKINDFTPNFAAMTTKKQQDRLALIAWAERWGGQTKYLAFIDEARESGNLTRKQAYDLKRAVRDAYSAGGSLTTPSEAITELDKKIAEAARFYR